MKLIVFVKEDQKNLIINLVNFICNNEYDIIFFTKFAKFIEFIYDCESKKLSKNLENPLDEFFLIFADYSLFPMDCVNPYLILPCKELAFPLCLYNDPFPNPKERAAYWLSRNRFYYNDFISEEQFSLLEEIFEKLQCVLLLPNVTKKISVICDSYKFENANEFKTEVKNQLKLENQNQLKIENQNQNKLEKKLKLKSQNKIKVKSKSLKIIKSKCEKTLPSSRCKLLKYFFSHLNEEIELETLLNFMWGNQSQNKSKSLYAYINDLRRMLENIANCEFKLLRTKKGFYKMQYIKNCGD